MPPKLTFESLLSDISEENKNIEFGFTTDKNKSLDYIYKKAEKIYDNFVDIKIEVANNEKLPYSSKEIGLPTSPMKTKSETGERQTADYVVYWKYVWEEEYKKLGLIFERKAKEDFHNTVIHGYKRFNAEINRFLDDPTTKYMLVLIESDRDSGLAFLPPKRYTNTQIRNLIAAKIGAVQSIEMRGVHVCWQGSRKSSANSIKGYVKHFFSKNCIEVLGL